MKKYVVSVRHNGKGGKFVVCPVVFNSPQEASEMIFKEAGEYIKTLSSEKYECHECHSEDIHNGTANDYYVYNGYEDCLEDCIIECEVATSSGKVVWTQHPIEVC